MSSHSYKPEGHDNRSCANWSCVRTSANVMFSCKTVSYDFCRWGINHHRHWYAPWAWILEHRTGKHPHLISLCSSIDHAVHLSFILPSESTGNRFHRKPKISIQLGWRTPASWDSVSNAQRNQIFFYASCRCWWTHHITQCKPLVFVCGVDNAPLIRDITSQWTIPQRLIFYLFC